MGGQARDAIEAAMGTEANADQAVGPCRNLVSYVFTADLIDLASFDPALDATFRGWIDQIRKKSEVPTAVLLAAPQGEKVLFVGGLSKALVDPTREVICASSDLMRCP